MAKWTAKKKNMDKRVNAYSKPGVSEVIYRDEWGNDDDGFPIYVYIIGVVIIAIILYVLLIK